MIIYKLAVITVLSAGLLISCGKTEPAPVPDTVSDAVIQEKLESAELEAHDTAIFMDYEAKHGEVKLMSADNGRTYTVAIDNLTEFKDNYGKVSVPELFEMGMIVEVDVSVHSKTLKSMQQAPDAFVRRDVEDFEINRNRGVFSLDDGTNLRITENTLVIKGDKTVKMTDISESDILLLRGIDHDLYSIKITSGYGHLRVKGAQYFEGGWIQIAGMFRPVSDDLLIDVPEGEYDLVVSYKGQGGTKHVVITRGKETKVDVSDLKGDLIKTGELVFTIRPPEADPTVKIDGEKVNHLKPVELEYGVYLLEVTAEGYTAIKERVAVGSEAANIDIELLKDENDSGEVSQNKTSKTASKPPASANELPSTLSSTTGVSANGTNTAGSRSSRSSSTGSTSNRSTSSSASSSASSSSAGVGTDSSIQQGSRIYIDAPATAEVYFDGIYKGIVPCSFPKESGTHVITLRKDGYETRTFTVTVDNSTQNDTYSFSALQEQ